MRTIREGFLRKNLGLGKEALIKNWLDEHKITNYIINNDLTIDVKGSVNLGWWYEEDQLPDYIQFGEVCGNFYVFSCRNLESLKGCPYKVDGSFDCNLCNKLTSLEGAPQKVGRNFDCSGCSKLKSLCGAPKLVGGNFRCKYYNKRFTIDDIKKICEVKGEIRI